MLPKKIEGNDVSEDPANDYLGVVPKQRDKTGLEAVHDFM
jgi:hypothetical protein